MSQGCTISVEEIQSWWEVPAIAHFCSLFRTAFNLPDFEIEVILVNICVYIHVNARLFSLKSLKTTTTVATIVSRAPNPNPLTPSSIISLSKLKSEIRIISTIYRYLYNIVCFRESKSDQNVHFLCCFPFYISTNKQNQLA